MLKPPTTTNKVKQFHCLKLILTLVLSLALLPTISQCQSLSQQTQTGPRECFNRSALPTATRSPSSSADKAGVLKSISITDPIQDFESGSVQIVNQPISDQISPRYTCFNISSYFLQSLTSSNPNYQVVASIQNIDGYLDKYGLDFSVRFSKKAPTHIQGIIVMSQFASWVSVDINYIITMREDFRVGQFIPGMGELLGLGMGCQSSGNGTTTSTELVLEHRITRTWTGPSNPYNLFALPFLSGIKTLDRQINMDFGRSTFNSFTGLIQIPVSTQSVQNPIEYIVISYLIVTMESDFQITNIYDLDYIPTGINVFVGMTGVNTVAPGDDGQQQVIGKLRSSRSSTGGKGGIENFKKSFHKYFQVQGLVIQSQSNLDLLFASAPTDRAVIATKIECISAQRCLGYGGYMNYDQNENGFLFHSECVLCQRLSSFNKQTRQCECKQGYQQNHQGQCVEMKRPIIQEKEDQKQNVDQKGESGNGGADKTAQCPEGFEYFEGTCYKLTFIWGDNNNLQREIQKSEPKANIEKDPTSKTITIPTPITVTTQTLTSTVASKNQAQVVSPQFLFNQNDQNKANGAVQANTGVNAAAPYSGNEFSFSALTPTAPEGQVQGYQTETNAPQYTFTLLNNGFGTSQISLNSNRVNQAAQVIQETKATQTLSPFQLQLNRISQANKAQREYPSCPYAQNKRRNPANPFQCICMQGANLIGGKCVFCHRSAFFNGNKCECLRNFVGDGVTDCQLAKSKQALDEGSLGLIFVPKSMQTTNQYNDATINSGASLRQQSEETAKSVNEINQNQNLLVDENRENPDSAVVFPSNLGHPFQKNPEGTFVLGRIDIG